MKKLIIGNWKMNLNFKASLVLAKNYLKLLKNNKQELVICPSEFALAEIKKIIKFSKIKLGAQNISAFERGAHTGSTDGQSLKELGCEFVIIGHSERREQGETSQQVNAKIKQALKNKLTPVVCVGESWEKYKAGHGRAWVANQIKQALAGVSLGQSRLIIAYEPIWAIGSGKPMA